MSRVGRISKQPFFILPVLLILLFLWNLLGFKEVRKGNKNPCRIDVEGFIKTAHILSDAFKAVGTSFACSAIAGYNEKKELVVGRNFDWPSMGYIRIDELVG